MLPVDGTMTYRNEYKRNKKTHTDVPPLHKHISLYSLYIIKLYQVPGFKKKKPSPVQKHPL